MDEGISLGLVMGLIQEATSADPAVIEQAVQDWLEEHPEATTTVADGSITEQKLAAAVAAKINQINQLSDEIDSVLVTEKSYNLLDYNQTEENKKIDYRNGELVTESKYITTGFIPVSPGKIYYSTKSGATVGRATANAPIHAFYSSDKSLIGTVSTTSANEFTAPENAAYLRVSFNTASDTPKQTVQEIQWMIVEHNPLYTKGAPFVPYRENTLVNSEDIDTKRDMAQLYAISKNKNLLCYDTFLDYIKLNTSNGYGVIDDKSVSSDYILIKPSTTYYMSAIRGTALQARMNTNEICFYGDDKTFISSLTSQYTFTTPENAKYVRVCWHDNTGYTKQRVIDEKMMLEEGASFTQYVAPDGTYKISPEMLNINDRAQINASQKVQTVQRHKAFEKRMLSIAHRGVTQGIPENTVPAIAYAGSHGYDAVEFDIQITSDGYYVLFHDRNLTIDGTTKTVNQWTLEEIKTYRFANYTGTAYADTEIPTLQEALTACIRSNLKPFIEIKQYPTYTINDIQNIYDICNEYGFSETAVFLSSNFDYVRMMNIVDGWCNLEYMINAAADFDSKLLEMRGLINGTNTIWCAIPHELITDANIAKIRTAGADYIIAGVGLGGNNQPVPDEQIKSIQGEMFNVVATA